jgi:hypothetical protein
LAIYSEAAIGAILECPRCQSMVQATPPPGWQPSPPPAVEQTGMSAPPVGPPPLDRVASSPVMLELEPPASLLDRLIGRPWLVGGIAASVTLATIFVLFLAFSRPKARSVALETESPATADPQPAKVVAKPDQSTAPAEPPSKSTKKSVDDSAPRSRPEEGHGASSASAVQPAQASPSRVSVSDRLLSMATGAANKATNDPRQIEVKKAPPVRVSVAARLADPVDQFELTETPLSKAVELLAAMGTLPVTLDVDALAQLGVAPHDPISLSLSSTTIGKALQAVVAQKGLAVIVENGQVIIGAPAEYRETTRTVRYTVADLTGEDQAAVAELAALVQKLVAPESWQAVGGRGTIVPNRGAMVVVQTSEVHDQVLMFCEKLRSARHKPLRSRENPERFALTTQRDRAQKMLDQPVMVNFHEPAPLARILAYLTEATGSEILVNRAALAAAETSDRVETSLAAKKQPLGGALVELLRPLGLTYRTIGSEVIQVTTREAAEDRLALEFYPLETSLAKQEAGLAKQNSPLPLGEGQGVRAASLLARVKSGVAPATWSDAGGSGEVYLDPPSQCLIVLQSQPVQAEVQRLLATKGEGGKDAGK